MPSILLILDFLYFFRFVERLKEVHWEQFCTNVLKDFERCAVQTFAYEIMQLLGRNGCHFLSCVKYL